MTSQSPRIYLYKITFEEVPYYYYGVHKEKTYNEYYMGSPKTNRWCWKLYTPKKQIVQFFDFTDEGWLEAQEVETRLIKPFFNADKWCLNEGCGGKVSLKVLKENGKKLVKKIKEENIGIFSMTQEELSKAGRKGGKMGAKTQMQNKTGVFGRTKEQMTEDGKKGAQKVQELGIGIFALTSEELSASAKKAYANGLGKLPKEVRSEIGRRNGRKRYEEGTGCFSLTPEQKSELSKRNNAQRWMCLETGYVSNSGGLSKYQKAKGIDTSKRKRIA
jgi:general stress protein YciG